MPETLTAIPIPYEQLEANAYRLSSTEEEHIPEVREDIKKEMLAKFETLDYQELKKKLLSERFADPELDVLTSMKGQVMKTSFLTLKARSDARNAVEFGRITRK